MVRHEGGRRFACSRENCKKTFTRRSILNDHLRSHDNERPFACMHCAKSFIRENDLKRHSSTHTEGKSHVCEGCKRSFTRKYALADHLKRSHRCNVASPSCETDEEDCIILDIVPRSQHILGSTLSSDHEKQQSDPALHQQSRRGHPMQPPHEVPGATIDGTSNAPSMGTSAPLPETLTGDSICNHSSQSTARGDVTLPTPSAIQSAPFTDPLLFSQKISPPGLFPTTFHQNAISPLDVMVCGLCQRRHALKIDYLNHLRLHLEDLESCPYRCNRCAMNFGWSEALFIHHTYMKCPRFTCGKTFSTHEALGRHLRGEDGSDICKVALEKSAWVLRDILRQKVDALTTEVGFSYADIWRDLESDVWDLGSGGLFNLESLGA